MVVSGEKGLHWRFTTLKRIPKDHCSGRLLHQAEQCNRAASEAIAHQNAATSRILREVRHHPDRAEQNCDRRIVARLKE